MRFVTVRKDCPPSLNETTHSVNNFLHRIMIDNRKVKMALVKRLNRWFRSNTIRAETVYRIFSNWWLLLNILSAFMCPKPIVIISFCVALISNFVEQFNVEQFKCCKYSFLSSMGKFSFQDCTCYLSCILPVNYWLIDSTWDMCDEWDASFNSSACFKSQFVVKHVLYAKQD